MFSIFIIFIPVIFIAVISFIIFNAVRGVNQWNKNNNSPVLTVVAAVVTKRVAINENHLSGDNGAAMDHTTTTRYFATFEVESGDRMELKVSGEEYGMLAEGDKGRLTFQGTRFKGFERNGRGG